MPRITSNIVIPDHEIELVPIRAQGAGGQNVNKVSSAIHLRFDIQSSSLSGEIKEKLLALPDRRISNDGIIVIKAQVHRQQERNREDALRRLKQLILRALHRKKARRPTRPGLAAKKRRLDSKKLQARKKRLRRKVTEMD